MIRAVWRTYVDLFLALLFLAAATLQVVLDDSLGAAEKLGSQAVVVAIAVAVSQRRRAPLVLSSLLLASLLARHWVPPGEDGVAYGIAAIVAAYTNAAYLEGRQLRAGAAVSAASGLYLMLSDGGTDLGSVFFYSLLFAAPWIAGRAMRVSRQRESLLEDRARLLEVQRDERARAAVAEERQRIARELHDVVAHAISVIVLQARGGRRMLESEPSASREAFDTIERTSTQALGEMRRLLGLLREGDEMALLPQPTLDRLDALADEVRSSGLPVEVSVEGAPCELPPGVDVSAYRIVQEALTNALKHAGPSRARVRVAYEPDSVLVEVIDDGSGEGSGAVSNGSGKGLIGIRERVAIVGGELVAGPRPSGGYAVSARLPYAAER